MTVSGLVPGTAYYFAIRASDDVPLTSAVAGTTEAVAASGSETYLPATLMDYCDAFVGPAEREPNDSRSDANGCLISGTTYTGTHDDDWDYYRVQV